MIRIRRRFALLFLAFAICTPAVATYVVCTPVYADEAGQADLDKAIELQLKAESLEDLDKIISLSEGALKKGLDDDNKTFAHQLLSSVYYERASQVSQRIVEGRIQPRRLRELHQQALDDLQKAVKYNPKFGDAQVLAAKLHALPGGDRQKGIAAASDAIKSFDDDKKKRSQALVLRAQLQDDPDKQLSDFDEATSNDPENPDAWQGKAILYLAREEFDKAVVSFRKLLEFDGNNALALNAIAEALLSQNKADEALQHLDKAIKVRPDVGVSYILRARINLAKEKDKEALEDLDQALGLDPRDVNALMLRCRIYQAQGELAKARADINRVLKLRPGAEPALLLRSFILAAEGKMVEAIEDINQLLLKDPKNVEWRLQLGSLYVADGRPRKAIELFTEILADEKKEWRVLRARGDALLSVGKHKEAVADYESALKIEPDDDGILNNFAWVLATSPMDDVRDAKRSLKLAERACEVTKYEMPHILSTLAAAHAEAGNFSEARKWSAKAVDMGKDELQEQLKKELENYENSKPWREIQNVEEKPDPVGKSKNVVDT